MLKETYTKVSSKTMWQMAMAYTLIKTRRTGMKVIGRTILNMEMARNTGRTAQSTKGTSKRV